jgi:hypothetical protein
MTEWVGRAAASAGPLDAGRALRELLRLHYRYRFDPRGLDDSERESLRREARNWLQRVGPAAEV